MKWNASLKAALTGCAALTLMFLGWRAYNTAQLAGFNPTPVIPGRVTLLGIDTSAGYRIVVANDVAQLADAESGRDRSGNEEAKNLRRIPIREFLKSLTGDADSVGKLVMSLNKIGEDELIGAGAVWKAEDVLRAVEGDSQLRAKLESDIHCGLDGMPPPEIRLKTLLGGIVIDSPVRVKVPIRGEVKEIEGRIREPFMTKFARAMEKAVGERFSPTQSMVVGLYKLNSSKTGPGGELAEDVAATMKGMVSQSRLQAFAENPERLLRSATVLINQDHITRSTYREWEGNDRKKYADIALAVNDDGKMRLWKYSDGKKDFQLMFVVDDVALAAPVITSVLNRNDVLLSQLPNLSLAKKAADSINSAH